MIKAAILSFFLNMCTHLHVTIEKNCTGISRNNLKCVYTNARSLGNKLDELFAFISLHGPDIVSITESWLNDRFNDGTVTPKGYEVYRRDRQEYNNQRGGGLAIFVKQEF